MSTSTMPGASGGQQKPLDYLGMELPMDVNCHVVAENSTQSL